jgi:hypothetical protein
MLELPQCLGGDPGGHGGRRETQWATSRRIGGDLFKILELKSAVSAPAKVVGHGYATREEALAAVKKHLKAFNVSGHNPEGNYWWVRDFEGLRKCWIAETD